MLWQSPSSLRNNAGVCPAGGQREDGAGIFSAHILTPETENSTFYFVAAARQKTRHTGSVTSDSLRARLAELRRVAFQVHDAPIIEAQQRMMAEFPHLTQRPSFLTVDAAPAQALAMLKKAIDEEQRAENLSRQTETDKSGVLLKEIGAR